jgi:hypothetical protein
MSAEVVEEFGVEDLSPTDLLDLAAANEREIREREALRLRLAYQWAVLHPVTDDTGVETPDGPAFDLEVPESLGGEGTPAVAAFTPEPFAHALGLSPRAGGSLIGDALDLAHRLPTLHQRVQALQVPAWQARRVAQQTRGLSMQAARWVDEQLNARSDGSLGPIITDRLVAHAAAKFDPEAQETAEERAQASWDVRLSHPDPTSFAGSSHLDAAGDTPTLTDFHQLVGDIAHQLHTVGDTRPLGVRKITAIRLITRLARQAITGQGAGTDDLDLDLAQLAQTIDKHAGKIQLITLVEAHDLDTSPDGPNDESPFGTAQVARLGAATIARLRQWVGHQAVQILPVLNMDRRDAVDTHDPPAWMATLVRLRDQHCVFPGCTTPAEGCDLDHINPYLPLDQGGHPRQTHPGALACLCRRHHRAKTAGRWRYLATPNGYLWFGPLGTRFLVTPHGYTRLAPRVTSRQLQGR